MTAAEITKWNADENLIRLTIGVKPFNLSDNYIRRRSDYQDYGKTPAVGSYGWYKGNAKVSLDVAQALDELLSSHPHLYSLAPLYDVGPLATAEIAADLKVIEQGLQ